MKEFAQEEFALMRCYKAESLHGLLGELQAALPHITDKLAADTTADCIDKLCRMTETDYETLQAAIYSCELF